MDFKMEHSTFHFFKILISTAQIPSFKTSLCILKIAIIEDKYKYVYVFTAFFRFVSKIQGMLAAWSLEISRIEPSFLTLLYLHG